MVFFNYALRKLNAKIVYYGPGLCGKTTTLQWIHDHFEGGQRGKMLSLATEGDRTIFFDLLPLEIGTIRGMQVTLQLYTVPGQVHYNSTRQLVLRGADGVVFVADSQRTMSRSNTESIKNLEENLLLQGVELKSFPCVLQFNKRDLRDIMGVDEMDQMLNRFSVPIFEAIATNGVGVQDTLEGIVKLVMRSLRERYEPVAAAGPRPMELPSSPPRPVVRPPTLRVPSAPPTGAASGFATPPETLTAGELRDLRAVTVDLRTATRPPGVGDPSPALAPPSGWEPKPVAGEEPRSLDDIPTAVFEAPELLEEPLLESEPTFLGVPGVELNDEVTATVLDAGEEVFLPGEEGAGAELPAVDEGASQLELEVAAEEPGDLLWGDSADAPLDAAVEGEAAEPPADEEFGLEPEVAGPENVEPEVELGDVVLDRDLGEGGPYEDRVRAPGPFAAVPLDRGEPVPEVTPEALAGEVESWPFEHLAPVQPEWGWEGSPFDQQVGGKPPEEPRASPFDETGTEDSPFGELPSEEPPAELDASLDEELDTAPQGAKTASLVDEPTPLELAREEGGLAAEEAPAEERLAEALPEGLPSPGRRWESTLPASTSVDDLVATVMPGRARRAAPSGVPGEAQAGPSPAAPPPAPPVAVPRSVARQPVWLDDGDPFAFEEEPRLQDERTPASVEVVPTVELAPRPSERVRAGENQLRVQLEGTGAIAEYGEVREMDIVVPVPGPWIGNRRVTLQLRLTLTPAAEDGDDGSGDPS